MSQAVGSKWLVHGAGDNSAVPPVGRHVEAGTVSECHHGRLQRSHLWVGQIIRCLIFSYAAHAQGMINVQMMCQGCPLHCQSGT